MLAGGSEVLVSVRGVTSVSGGDIKGAGKGRRQNVGSIIYIVEG